MDPGTAIRREEPLRTCRRMRAGAWLMRPGASGSVGAISLAALVILCACASEDRPRLSEAELVQRGAENAALAAARRADAERRLLRRMREKQNDYLAGRIGTPPTFDVLILSGGGDYGAFGAGFLEGWSTVTDPAWSMPEFDLVTGVSTGALLAPFAFLGDPDSLRQATALYRAPNSDWITRRGLLFFLPGNVSLLNIDGLKRDIVAAFPDPVVRRVVAESERGRVLAIGTTNLDFGRKQVWDLGAEGREALRSGSVDRFVDILLASSAIPGAFPPIEIDGCLYADGGITANIFYNATPAVSGSLAALWRQEFPGSPMPRGRFWVIINNQLEAPPETTSATWTGVVRTSVSTAIRSATTMALDHLVVQLALLDALGVGGADVRYITIPEEWRPPVPGSFQPETMSALADLGFQMGADPRAWRSRARRMQELDRSESITGELGP